MKILASFLLFFFLVFPASATVYYDASNVHPILNTGETITFTSDAYPTDYGAGAAFAAFYIGYVGSDGVFAEILLDCKAISNPITFDLSGMVDNVYFGSMGIRVFDTAGCIGITTFDLTAFQALAKQTELFGGGGSTQIVQNPTQDIAVGVLLLLLVCFVTVISLYKRSGHK